MFRLLSDSEVALNELLVACRESIDHYQDATHLVEQPELSKSFHEIVAGRKLFLPRLESAIRMLGDLPSVPDPDKEAGEMALHHLGAAISADYTHEVLTQRINAEKHILELANSARAIETNKSHNDLINDLSHHIETTIRLLTDLTPATHQ